MLDLLPDILINLKFYLIFLSKKAKNQRKLKKKFCFKTLSSKLFEKISLKLFSKFTYLTQRAIFLKEENNFCLVKNFTKNNQEPSPNFTPYIKTHPTLSFN